MARGQSPYQGRYTVPTVDFSPIERGGAAWGQAFKDVGGAIGEGIEKYKLNEQKRSVLNEKLKGMIAGDPNLLFALAGDSPDAMKDYEDFAEGNATLKDVEAMMGKAVGYGEGEKSARERVAAADASKKSGEVTEYYRNKAEEVERELKALKERGDGDATLRSLKEKNPNSIVTRNVDKFGDSTFQITGKDKKKATFTRMTWRDERGMERPVHGDYYQSNQPGFSGAFLRTFNAAGEAEFTKVTDVDTPTQAEIREGHEAAIKSLKEDATAWQTGDGFGISIGTYANALALGTKDEEDVGMINYEWYDEDAEKKRNIKIPNLLTLSIAPGKKEARAVRLLNQWNVHNEAIRTFELEGGKPRTENAALNPQVREGIDGLFPRSH